MGRPPLTKATARRSPLTAQPFLGRLLIDPADDMILYNVSFSLLQDDITARYTLHARVFFLSKCTACLLAANWIISGSFFQCNTVVNTVHEGNRPCATVAR